MNALQIGLAELIAQKDSGRLNDQQVHQIKYGKQILKKSFVIVKTPKEERFQEFNLSDNVRVFPTHSKHRYWFLWDAWQMARKIIKENPIDLLALQDPFITGPIGYLLKKEFGLPMNVNDVCDFVDNPFWMKEKWFHRVLNPIGKFILRKADSIRVDNNQEHRKLVGLGIEREKIWNIPFILNDGDQFVSTQPDPEFRHGLLRNKFEHMVLFIGRLEDQKDLPTLFKTVKKVIQSQPKTLFLIIGDGKKSSEIKALEVTLGIKDNLLFLGWVDYFDLPKYYAVSDAFILTSKYETSPRVVIFACLSRKPIVATDVSGVKDFVEEGKNGFVVSVGDEEGLAKGVLALIGNVEKAREMGGYGLNKVKELLNEEKILEEYKKMWEFTMIAGKGNQ
jgi:glycosyltransferase involved in cell wall biosynthesis